MSLCHLCSDVYSSFIYPFQIRFLTILRQPRSAKMNNSSENVNVTQASPPICSRSTEPRSPAIQLDKDRGILAATGFSLTQQHSGHLDCIKKQTFAHSSESPHRQYGCEL